MVLCGPYSCGQSFQRQPTFCTCMIPLKIRRSSFRAGPGWLVGKCGSIFDHCSSLNQNKSALIGLAPNRLTKPLNQHMVNWVLTLERCARGAGLARNWSCRVSCRLLRDRRRPLHRRLGARAPRPRGLRNPKARRRWSGIGAGGPNNVNRNILNNLSNSSDRVSRSLIISAA
jgi:hypothetical protein